MLRLGDVIDGRYRIDAVIGNGGMSVVYRATHVHLGQPVALKVLFTPDDARRLEREARAAACIRGEHVVRVFDIGRLAGETPYLVMEYVDGEDLSKVLARQPRLDVDVALDTILQACEAVAQAHALGIVHRDLKPANLLVTAAPDGTPLVKVLDFGISRGPFVDGAVTLTDPGIVFGTPSYMAPEQMEGKETADQRVDVWALGAILYEMVTGRPPFEGDALPRVFMDIMTRKLTRPSQLRSDVPRGLDTVIARCLTVDPQARFASVVDLAWALAELGPVRGRERAARVARTWDRGRALGVASVGAGRPSVRPERRAARRLLDAWRRPMRMALAGTALVALPLLSVVARSYGAPEQPPVARARVTSSSSPPDSEGPLTWREPPPSSREGGARLVEHPDAAVPLRRSQAAAPKREASAHTARAPLPATVHAHAP